MREPHHERTLVTEIRPLENEHHVQPFLSYPTASVVGRGTGCAGHGGPDRHDPEATERRSCSDNIREAFQIYDKEASGYVDRETFFKICGLSNSQLMTPDYSVSRSYFSG